MTDQRHREYAMMSMMRTVFRLHSPLLAAARHAPLGADLSDQAHQDHRLHHARRHHRHPGALPRRPYHRQDRPDRIIDNRAGGSRQHRHERGVARRARRLHARLRQYRQHHDQPVPVQQLNYDPLNDLVPIGPVGTVPLFLTVNATACRPRHLGVHRLREGQPRQGELCRRRRRHHARSRAAANSRAAPGSKLVVVPHRGTGPATQAVIVGDVQVTFVSMGPHIEIVRKGVLRVLAAATPKRMPYVPDVPTFARAGFSGLRRRKRGSRCSRRAARRRRSSTSSTPIPAARRRIPRSASGWPRPSSIR